MHGPHALIPLYFEVRDGAGNGVVCIFEGCVGDSDVNFLEKGEIDGFVDVFCGYNDSEGGFVFFRVFMRLMFSVRLTVHDFCPFFNACLLPCQVPGAHKDPQLLVMGAAAGKGLVSHVSFEELVLVFWVGVMVGVMASFAGIGEGHAATETENKVEGGLLLDVVIPQRPAVLQLLAGKNETLLVGGDAFLVLDFGLDHVNCVGGLYFQGDGFARECLDENLHGYCLWVGC